MSGGIFNVGSSGQSTPKGFQDRARPAAMIDADKVFIRLNLKSGGAPIDVLELMSKIGDKIQRTKSFEVDDLWRNIERGINNGNTITVKAENSAGRVHTALGLFYSALESIDQNATTTLEFSSLREVFQQTATHSINKFRRDMDSRDQRVLDRVISTIEQRFTAIATRLNEGVEAGTISGPSV